MKQLFHHAIVRRPCRNLVNGLTDANLGKPNYKLALKQHDNYIKALGTSGLSVEVLEADEKYPDSCFIEDVALCTPEVAIITRPGANSRRGEIESIEPVLRNFYAKIEQISAPGTLEAGDVMMVSKHYYIGISSRTNKSGADQLILILKKHGMTGSVVPLEKALHLKTSLAYLENNNLLVAGEFTSGSVFSNFNRTGIPENEAYAANCIWVNGNVIMPAGFPLTKENISVLGYPVLEVEMSEFQKLDGGVSCLSLRF